jgi:hypothetical protein
MMERLPKRLRDNPQIQQEATRLLLEATARMTIDAIQADPDRPVFLPALNVVFNAYQPNADTTYKNAIIAPGGTYRLRGTRGSIPFMRVGQFAPMGAATTNALAYNDFDTLKLDANGRFDVIVSPERPKDYAGDWWRLDPRAARFVLRQVGYDWAAEHDPQIAIERLDHPVARPRVSAAELQKRLDALPKLIGDAAINFVDHVEKLRTDGFINKLRVFDTTTMPGLLAGQSYYEGAYELGADEALILEVKVPQPCKYFSLILTNDIYETTDWVNNQSSLNGAQARLDKDGFFRAVISAKDPGVANWVDTAGYSSGAVQGRWLECAGAPTPTLRKVKLNQVRRALPKDTPLVTAAQRDQIVRDRRAAAQQRPLW